MKIQIVATLFIGFSFFSFNAEAAPITCNARQSATTCLLCNCYHETRGESRDGMVAVAKVVLSRADSGVFPSSVCGVIYQPYQFSWTQDRIRNNINATTVDDKKALNECKGAITTANNEGANGVLYYYNPSIASPAWARQFNDCGPLGNHVFMTPKGTACPRKLGASGIRPRQRPANSRGVR
ncbi:cell wall hydrolase [Bdellovibrio reynosensis]|uniref:Cell wall hydrolase n=1 Tax=Bdellovibrio reynosensis TaxID=2835041 RepID=A0ABY4CJP3_9BACT|nr:cell wall hydrolase [Bdellovibrio reynosensis]UOF02455.1 cell wall hydrolase [Bdellovibrio reynosensis]